MRKEINTTVVDEYPRYVRIQSDIKRLGENQICLHQDQRRKNQQSSDSDIIFDAGNENARLNMTVNVDKMKSFAFKLFCDSFMPEPCYRFDSDGPFHRNPESDGVTLSQRQIPTPHFHKYDEKGRVIAYRTNKLIAEESSLLADYEKAMWHFCDEENVVLQPETHVFTETLQLGAHEFVDPLEGVEFP